MHRFEWPDEDGVEFHISHGDRVRLLRASGFEITDLVEIQAPPGASTSYGMSPEWAPLAGRGGGGRERCRPARANDECAACHCSTRTSPITYHTYFAVMTERCEVKRYLWIDGHI
jgi:hypothetical protein